MKQGGNVCTGEIRRQEEPVNQSEGVFKKSYGMNYLVTDVKTVHINYMEILTGL